MKTKNELAILFGNGPNYQSSNFITWTNLLKGLCMDADIVCNIHDCKPYSMIYEEILIKSKCTEESLKKRIVEKLESLESNTIYDQLRDLKIKHYITTNYDFSLEKSFLQNNYNINYNSSLTGGAEKLYSIRTKTNIKDSFDNEIANIWHIHGDIKRPKSICLGLDHYCGSVSKMKSYIQNKGYDHCKNSIEDKLKTASLFDDISWIELFYKTDIHIIGLNFDFIEIDLWWVLNKRARMSGVHKNKIVYHEIEQEINNNYDKEKLKAKKELLNVFGVEYKGYPYKEDNKKKWDLFYEKAFEYLRLEYMK